MDEWQREKIEENVIVRYRCPVCPYETSDIKKADKPKKKDGFDKFDKFFTEK
jgi:hypothetical protein